jgi:ABC-type glycerol-3-phosphate transport system permease component
LPRCQYGLLNIGPNGRADEACGTCQRHHHRAVLTVPFCTWLLVSYFNSIPLDLEESASIDRRNRLDVLWRIVLPPVNAHPGGCLLLFVSQAWNDFMYALANALMTALPPVLTRTLTQRFVTKGLVVGGWRARTIIDQPGPPGTTWRSSTSEH